MKTNSIDEVAITFIFGQILNESARKALKEKTQ